MDDQPLDMLDQSDNVDMVLPSVLAVIELLSPDDYNLLVRHQIKKLFNSTTSVQVVGAVISYSDVMAIAPSLNFSLVIFL